MVAMYGLVYLLFTFSMRESDKGGDDGDEYYCQCGNLSLVSSRSFELWPMSIVQL